VSVFNFSGSEIFFLMILGLVILGPEKLPGVIRKAGKLYGEFKRITNDAQSEFKGAFGDTIGDLKETAQGYKSMFDAASQQVNSTLSGVGSFDHDTPNIPSEIETSEPEPEPEPKFVPFDIGIPESQPEKDR
jgi:sec-independent protein translocase protein TatB